ncbi:MAG: 6-phosphofructokinase [Peptostreptococcales bacterium]
MKKIGILTSGGDSPGMNAAIRAVVRRALYENIEVAGIYRGYAGLITGDIKNLDTATVADKLQRGGTFLGTARSEEFRTEEGFQKALNILKIFRMDGLVVVGGDGSLRGALELGKAGIKVIGIPATIDNDLGFTDYSIGFDTAVNTVLLAIANIKDTSSSHRRGTIIEVMGRNCGDIALYAGLAGGAEVILVPEEKIDVNKVCEDLIIGKNKGKLHNIILLAEGASIKAEELMHLIQKKAGIECRLTVLGHIQRGGSPTASDRILASKLGNRAVELLISGQEKKAVGVHGNRVTDHDLEEALEMKKMKNEEMYKLASVLTL